MSQKNVIAEHVTINWVLFNLFVGLENERSWRVYMYIGQMGFTTDL